MVTFGKLGRYGRLGNAMFQVASTIGISKANGYDFAFPEWINHDAAERFGSAEDLNIGEWFPNWKDIPRLTSELPEHFINWGWQGLQHPDGVSYVGHMQSEKYFSHCSDYIRHIFKFRDRVKKNGYTAVHVRCGDYGSDYHPVCTKEYYEQALEIIPGPYIVFSDEPQKARQILGKLDGDDNYYHLGNTYEALHTMTECRRHIIANSTFSWWGAWLADSEQVIAPSIWFGPAAAHLETRDIYCQNWKII